MNLCNIEVQVDLFTIDWWWLQMVFWAMGLTTPQNSRIHGRYRLVLQDFVNDLAADVIGV